MSDITQAELEAGLPVAFARGRAYVNHLEQLAAGVPVDCSGCAIDSPAPWSASRSDSAGLGDRRGDRGSTSSSALLGVAPRGSASPVPPIGEADRTTPPPS